MKTKGTLILKCTDTVTGKVRTEEVENALTLFNLLVASNTRNPHGWWYARYIHLSDVKIVPGSKDVTILSSMHYEDSRTGMTNAVLDTTNDYYQESTSTFLSTGSTETIETIYVSSSSNATSSFTNTVISYASLATPFIKGANEVLQVTYRYSIDTNTLGFDDRLAAVKDFMHSGGSTSTSNLTATNYTNLSSVAFNFYSKYIWDTPATTRYTIGASNGSTLTTGRASTTFDLVKTDLVGKILRGTCLSSAVGSADISNCVNSTSHLVVDSDDNVKFFLSPLMNHTNNTTTIYEDFNNLATGLGYPSIRLSSPTNEYPDARSTAYFMAITKSGNKGVARYVYHIKPVIAEFTDSGRTHGISPLQYVKSGTISTSVDGVTGELTTQVDYPSKTGTTDLSCYKPLTEPDSYSTNSTLVLHKNNYAYYYNLKYSIIVSNDTTALEQQICFMDFNDPENVIYFGTNNSSAGLPLLIKTKSKLDLSTQFMTRDDTGSLYFATNDGICKITDPLGSATLSYYTNSQVGLLTSDIILNINSSDNNLFIVTNSKVAYSNDMISWTTLNTTKLSNNIINSLCKIMADGDVHFIGTVSYVNETINISTDTVTNTTATNVKSVNTISKFYSNKIMGLIANKHNSSIYYNYTLTNGTKLSISMGSPITTISQFLTNYPDKLGNYCLASYGSSAVGAYISGAYTLNGVFLTIREPGDPVIDAGYAKVANQEKVYEHSVGDGLDVNDPKYFTYNGLGQSAQQHEFTRPGVVEENDPNFANGYMNNLKGISTVYRWDNTNSQWKPDWNVDSPATADGSSTLLAKRFNFHTDSNRFNAYSSLDISDAVNTATYNANGLTVAMTVTPEVKITPTFSSSWKNSACKEDPLTCLVEITDTVNDVSITLMQVGTTNRTVFVDSTNPIAKTQYMTEIDLEILPTLAQRRYTMTVSSDGTTVEVFRDGNQIGASITLNTAFTMNSTYEVSIGSRNRSYFGFSPYKGCCAKGKIENIQVCNTKWTNLEITNDSNSPLAITNSASTIVRYLMTADYNEGKVCNDTVWQPISGGLEIKFPDGNLSADSYVANQYYNTFKTEGGLVKTNTETMTIKAGISHSGIQITKATSIIDGTTTAPASSAIVTEPATFNHNATAAQMAVTVGNVSEVGSNKVRFMNQAGDGGDLIFEWDSAYDFGNYKIRISDVTNTADSYNISTNHYQLQVKNNTGGLEFKNSTGTVTTNATNISSGDRLRLTYSSATNDVQLALYDTVGSVWNNVGATVSVTGITNPSVSFVGYLAGSLRNVSGISNATVTYNCDSRYMRLGDKATSTGQFSTNYFETLTNYDTGHYQIAGVDALVTYSSTYDRMFSTAEPVVGTIALSRGHIMLNSADKGKVININNVTVHYG